MLSGARLGYDACLAHLLCYENLSQGIVYLVSTGMVKVLTLEVQLAAILLTHTLGKVQR